MSSDPYSNREVDEGFARKLGRDFRKALRLRDRDDAALLDIVVTNPQRRRQELEYEVEEAWFPDGFFFRTFRNKPRYLDIGSRVYEVEDGYIIGFFTVTEIRESEMVCGTTRKNWGEGFHAITPTISWVWIEPIPLPGFQGFRYFPKELVSKVQLKADWLGNPAFS